jgi:septal ring factor EnvC (AmiA/AmiB activator)
MSPDKLFDVAQRRSAAAAVTAWGVETGGFQPPGPAPEMVEAGEMPVAEAVERADETAAAGAAAVATAVPAPAAPAPAAPEHAAPEPAADAAHGAEPAAEIRRLQRKVISLQKELRKATEDLATARSQIAKFAGSFAELQGRVEKIQNHLASASEEESEEEDDAAESDV